MKAFLRWLHETDAAKTNALLGAVGFALTLTFVGLMSAIAFGAHVGWNRVIEVPDVWVKILDSMLIATAVWAGVSQAAQIGRRAVTNPKVIEAEGKVEAEKKVTEARVDVIRASGEMQAMRPDNHVLITGAFPVVSDTGLSAFDAVDAPQAGTAATAHTYDPGA